MPTDFLTTTAPDESLASTPRSEPPLSACLVVAWSVDADVWGRVYVIPPLPRGVRYVIGRGPPSSRDPYPRLLARADRPGTEQAPGLLCADRISRVQLVVQPVDEHTLRVENVGRARMRHKGRRVSTAEVRAGETLQLASQLLLCCIERPAWAVTASTGTALPEFGEPDSDGLVGESLAMSKLRSDVRRAAEQGEPVLITGESGTGKELVARAIHARSTRGPRPLVARNAATLPESLIDAELFGNAKHYPNAGMPERPGLLGQAHGTTLFLDEIAELPEALQTHLLRVLDAGEYQRLGEAVTRHADLRWLAATNRPELLRSELAARFKLRIRTPGLNERREDIPLLTWQLLRAIAAGNENLARRLFPEGDLRKPPRLSLELMRALLEHTFTTHVRELEGLLWESIAQAAGDALAVPASLLRAEAEAVCLDEVAGAPQEAADPATFSAEAVAKSLEENDWVVERTWRALGLTSRHVLTRLIAKHRLQRPR